MADLVEDLLAYAANPQQRIRMGITSIDEIIEGPAAGEVCTIVGRSYSGKSIIATLIMANNPELPMVFFSLEMPARQALQRLYAQWSGVDHHSVEEQVRRNTLPTSRLEEFAEAFERHLIVDRPSLTLGDMSTYLHSYTTMFGERPAAVLIDYMELVGGAKSSGEGWQRTEAVAGALKDWAKAEDMPVFVLHQANKSEPEWKPPTADSARGGGFTEADIVLGLWQPSRNPELSSIETKQLDGEIHVKVLKNRVTGRHGTGAPIRLHLRDDLTLGDLSALDARQGEMY